MYSRTFAEAFAETKTLPQAPVDLHLVICQDKDLTVKHLRTFTATVAKTKTLPQASVQHHRGIRQDKNLTASTCGPSPRHLPRQKYRKHLRTFAEAFAKTKTLPQAPVDLHLVVCQDKDLTASTCGPSARHLSRQKPYRKLPRNITEAFAKTKTLPQASAKHHRGIRQNKNLTTSIRETKTKTRPQAPADLHRGIRQDKNLTRSIRETSPKHSPRQKPYHKHPLNITEAFTKTKTLPQAPADLHHAICQEKNLTAGTREP